MIVAQKRTRSDQIRSCSCKNCGGGCCCFQCVLWPLATALANFSFMANRTISASLTTTATVRPSVSRRSAVQCDPVSSCFSCWVTFCNLTIYPSTFIDSQFVRITLWIWSIVSSFWQPPLWPIYYKSSSTFASCGDRLLWLTKQIHRQVKRFDVIVQRIFADKKLINRKSRLQK